MTVSYSNTKHTHTHTTILMGGRSNANDTISVMKLKEGQLPVNRYINSIREEGLLFKIQGGIII